MSQTTSQPTPPAIPPALAHARADFPILQRSVHGKPLVYLDNAASTQKPQVVIDAVTRYYANENANIHRGVHLLSTEATGAYETARGKIATFINAADDSEIVYTRGATESVNLVAHSFVEPKLQAGDEILISAMEHHANIVPWQLLCERVGAKLKVIPVTDDCDLDLTHFDELLNEKTKLLSLVYVSNAIGTVNDIAPLLAKAKAKGIPTLVDAAQAIQHMPIDVQQLGCDFLVASGHKIYGPTGIGILYGRRSLLDGMRPYQGGGDMIAHVAFEGSTFKEPPSRFEAGTPHIEGAIGLGAAVDYLSGIGLQAIHDYESDLIAYAVAKLQQIEGLTIVGNPRLRSGAISFTMGDAHPHDIGTVLDTEGVAIRSGHHCCEPLMKRLGVPATARASFSLYNTPADVDALAAALKKTAILFM
ncbi:cysteine desulfurase [Pelagicoccus sp. NFK12]|uniref:Cysteine desulfurase n=1 Tax=Pelagicoccus enzymogenes TaxID=2773457 RepID=A0A927FAX1_9BACT|nr:cysteine desulfurase [Pelagicoccus enzymogenes]MBD5781733.1 cysteine desulfurase [Pelagicoccus enzymogenes]MDQ8199987.1 cysteine desulfurase [Pelagicoccus enzymogenes]